MWHLGSLARVFVALAGVHWTASFEVPVWQFPPGFFALIHAAHVINKNLLREANDTVEASVRLASITYLLRVANTNHSDLQLIV